MAGLRVGLDLLHLADDSGGSGTYARGLVPALAAADPGLELVLHVGTTAPAWVDGVGAEVVRWPVSVSAPRARGAAAYLAAHWSGLARHTRRRPVDLLHGLANVVPPRLPGTARVVTVHDVLWRRHARTMGLRGTVGFEVVTAVSTRVADVVLAPTRAARDAVVRAYRLPAGRTAVVPLGVGAPDGPATPAAVLRERYGLGDRPVVLAVGQKRSHKNLAVLVRALPELPGVVLVLPGTPTAHEQDLRGLAGRLGVGDRVVTPPWLPDEDLRGLRASASVAALPSWDEGFGLPVLEAMAAGVPVVCSDIPALREVAAGAALLADPASPGAVAAALRRALHDPTPLVAAGRARAAACTWDVTARGTLEAYARAVVRTRARR